MNLFNSFINAFLKNSYNLMTFPELSGQCCKFVPFVRSGLNLFRNWMWRGGCAHQPLRSDWWRCSCVSDDLIPLQKCQPVSQLGCWRGVLQKAQFRSTRNPNPNPPYSTALLPGKLLFFLWVWNIFTMLDNCKTKQTNNLFYFFLLFFTFWHGIQKFVFFYIVTVFFVFF